MKKIIKFVFTIFFIILMGFVSVIKYNKDQEKKILLQKKLYIEEKEKNENETKNKEKQIQNVQQEELNKENYFFNLEKKINEKISIYGDSIGFAFYDINSNTKIQINGDKYFNAASTSKVPLNMVLYDKVFNGEINLNSSVYYNNEYFEDGTGIIQFNIQSSYTLNQLCEYSIKYSDNIATNMLYEYLGGYSSVRYWFDNYLGYNANHSGNMITPNQSNTYLKILYENKNNNPYYDILIDNLKNTQFKIRMEQNLTNGIVAHKIGTYSSFVNDIGIVYAKNPFILSIFTDNIGCSETLITDLTDFLYVEQNKNLVLEVK